MVENEHINTHTHTHILIYLAKDAKRRPHRVETVRAYLTTGAMATSCIIHAEQDLSASNKLNFMLHYILLYLAFTSLFGKNLHNPLNGISTDIGNVMIL